MNGLTSSEEKIEGLIRAHILALGDDSATPGYVSAGPGSRAFERSDLWHEGEKQFLELERCLEMMGASAPKQLAHLKARYYQCWRSTRDVQRRGDRWVGLAAHQQVVCLPGGSRTDVSGTHRSHRKALVTERVGVETWAAWVHMERVRRGLAFIHGQFLRDRIEPCVPASVYRAA